MEVLKNLQPILKAGTDQLLDEESALGLARTRNALNLQLKAVALEVGISHSYLHDLETGNRHLRLRMFERIKAAMERLAQDV